MFQNARGLTKVCLRVPMDADQSFSTIGCLAEQQQLSIFRMDFCHNIETDRVLEGLKVLLEKSVSLRELQLCGLDHLPHQFEEMMEIIETNDALESFKLSSPSEFTKLELEAVIQMLDHRTTPLKQFKMKNISQEMEEIIEECHQRNLREY